jgi:histone H3/H4
MPEALDEALLRPGRIDRIYRVGYPSKAGRVRTYEGYLKKVSHELSADQIDKLATITPYATGATIKDLVNEALIIAIRDGREIITWKDVVRAKQLKDLGPPEDVEYIERERHAVAVHEACHAVVAFRTRQHMEIDIATIEKGSDYLGMVASIPPEDQFTRWRSEYMSDILVSLASLAGERMFFDGDSSSGVSGDLESATAVASFMEGYWGMGSTVSSYSTARRLEVGSPGGGRGGPSKGESTEKVLRAALADRIEDQLGDLLTQAEEILKENRLGVLSLAHALETHKTLSGEDVEAVLEHREGITVDGTVYADPDFTARLEEYHASAAGAHRGHTHVSLTMPEGGRLQPPVPDVPIPEPVGAVPDPWSAQGHAPGLGYGQAPPAPGNGQPAPWYGPGYPPPQGNGQPVPGNGAPAAHGAAPGYPPAYGTPPYGAGAAPGYAPPPGDGHPQPGQLGEPEPAPGNGQGSDAWYQPGQGDDQPQVGEGNSHAAPPEHGNGHVEPAPWQESGRADDPADDPTHGNGHREVGHTNGQAEGAPTAETDPNEAKPGPSNESGQG